MKVQFDKSYYSTVEKSCCLVDVKTQSHQSRTVNPCLFKCMYVGGYRWVQGEGVRVGM